MIAALNEPGKYPGSAGTRNLHDNLSDLRAQVEVARVELDRALGLDSRFIGINNRNLHTFETTLETTETPNNKTQISNKFQNSNDQISNIRHRRLDHLNL